MLISYVCIDVSQTQRIGLLTPNPLRNATSIELVMKGFSPEALLGVRPITKICNLRVNDEEKHQARFMHQ